MFVVFVLVGVFDCIKYFGSSDVVGIFGISFWCILLDVYLDKVQLCIGFVDLVKQKIFICGQWMEFYVIDLLVEEIGLKIIGCGNCYCDQQYDFMVVEIDVEVVSGENIEIKMVSLFKVKDWGEVQIDVILVYYIVQVMYGLMVIGCQVCIFGVLIGGDDFCVYCVEWDDEIIVVICEKEVEFWGCIQCLDLFEVIVVSDIFWLFECDVGISIEVDGKVVEVFNCLCELKVKVKGLEYEIEFVEECIKFFMQDYV